MIRDTLASLEGRLDDVRREHIWRAIPRRLEHDQDRARRRWWLVVLVPAAAAAAPALAIAMLRQPHASPPRPPPPSLVPSRAVPHATAPAPHSTPAPVRITTPRVPDPPVLDRAPVARPGAHVTRPRSATPVASAAEQYRRAEASLAAGDDATATKHLVQLLHDHPRGALVDPARYDLALIAHRAGDDARARALLDALVASGSHDAVRTAAERLRRRLAAEPAGSPPHGTTTTR